MKNLTTYFIIAAAILTAACTETLNTHGQVLTESALSRVQVGTSSKDDVKMLLGSPSTTSEFANEWYYISSVVKSKPLDQNILQQRKVLAIKFDDNNKVASINQLNEDDGKTLEPDEEITPTQGQSLGIIDQLMKNLGRGSF